MWPMAIATPTIAALFGTAWAVSHPAFVTVRPRLVVPVRQSLGDVLVTALFWGAIGVGAVMSSDVLDGARLVSPVWRSGMGRGTR